MKQSNRSSSSGGSKKSAGKSTAPVGIRRAVADVKSKYPKGLSDSDARMAKRDYVTGFQDVVSESSLSNRYDKRTLSEAAKRVAESRWTTRSGFRPITRLAEKKQPAKKTSGR